MDFLGRFREDSERPDSVLRLQSAQLISAELWLARNWFAYKRANMISLLGLERVCVCARADSLVR